MLVFTTLFIEIYEILINLYIIFLNLKMRILSIFVLMYVKMILLMKRSVYVNMKKNKLKIFLIAIIIVVLLCAFFLLPDFIYLVRETLKNIPLFNNLIQSKISNITYISIIITPLFSLLAVVISIQAFRNAKSTGQIQLLMSQAKTIETSNSLFEFLHNNLKVINHLHLSIGNRNSFKKNEISMQEIAFLYCAKEISKDEYKKIKTFIQKSNKVYMVIQSGNEKEIKTITDDFYKYYYNDETEDINEDIKALKEKIKKITERED